MNKLRNAIIFLVAYIFLNNLTVYSGELKSGIISEIKGKAEVKRSGVKIGAEIMQMLFVNDEITVAGNSSVIIKFLKDRHTETINGPCSVKIGINGTITDKGSKNNITVKSSAKQGNFTKDVAMIQSANAGFFIRYSKINHSNSSIKLIGEVNSITLFPEFKWAKYPQASFYVFRLIKNKKIDQDVIYEVNVTEPFISYTIQMPSLSSSDTYLWQVTAYNKNGEFLSTASRTLKILSEDEVKKIISIREKFDTLIKEEPKNRDLYLIIIKEYLKNELFVEALPLMVELSKICPSDTALKSSIKKIKEMTE